MPKKKRERSKSAVTKAMLKRLNVERIQLATVRDHMREIAEEATEHADVADEALEALDTTIETLSRHV